MTQRMRNPQTNEVVELRGGKWVPVKQSRSIVPAPIAEYAASANRGIAAIPDFFVDAGNYALEKLNPVIPGEQAPQIPRVQDTLEKATGGAFGQRGFMEPGTARDVVQAAGEWTPAAVGVAAGQQITKSRQIMKDAIGQVAKRGSQRGAKLAEAIARGDRDAATKSVASTGAIVTNKPARRAVHQGFDPGVVSAIKVSTPQTKAQMRRMVDVLEAGRRNQLFQARNRPADVVGDALSSRLKHINQTNRKAAMELEGEARKLVGKPLDFSNPINRFVSDLSDMGVYLDETQDGIKVVFDGSDIDGITAAESLVAKVIKRIKSMDGGAYEAHRLKRYIDELVNYGKTAEGLTGKTESVVKQLRRGLDEVLDANFPSYNKVNTTFSDTRQAIDNFMEAAGTSMKRLGPEGQNIEKQLGTLSRRFLSNVTSRAALYNSLDEINEVAAKYGASFADDPVMLALFSDELDNVFKPVARTSLAGDVTKAAMVEGRGGAIRQGAEYVYDKARGVNDENALKAIRELLLEP